MNSPVIFLAKGALVHPSLRGTNLVTRCGFPEGYYVIANKEEYMDDDTWKNVAKVASPGIKKMKMISVFLI